MSKKLYNNVCLLLSPSQEVTIPNEDIRRDVNALFRYQKSGRGRVLKQGYAPLALLRGWRLEPTSEHPDVDDFNEHDCPFTCVFYIGGKHGRVLV